MDKMLKNQEKTNKYDNIVSGVFAPLFLYYVIHNVAVIGGLAILELAVGKVEMLNLGEEGLFYARTVVRMAGMALGGVAVYPYYVREQAKNKKKSLSLKIGTALVLGGALLSLGINYLFAVTGFIESSAGYQQVAEVQFALPLWMAFMFYGILSPVVEEMVFRGIACNRLCQNTSHVMGIVGSALLFGVFHGNVVQMLYGTLMGVVMGYVYGRYHNLTAPILVHSAANIAIYVITYFF